MKTGKIEADPKMVEKLANAADGLLLAQYNNAVKQAKYDLIDMAEFERIEQRIEDAYQEWLADQPENRGSKSNEPKFQVGDIVEILNLSKEQIEGILSQTNFTRSVENLKSAIVGSRYKIAGLTKHYRTQEECAILGGWNQGGHACEIFTFWQIRLYHREEKGGEG